MQYREVIVKNRFPLYHKKRTMELEWKTKAFPDPNTVPIITIILLLRTGSHMLFIVQASLELAV